MLFVFEYANSNMHFWEMEPVRRSLGEGGTEVGLSKRALGWLGDQDSNLNCLDQNQVSYH